MASRPLLPVLPLPTHTDSPARALPHPSFVSDDAHQVSVARELFRELEAQITRPHTNLTWSLSDIYAVEECVTRPRGMSARRALGGREGAGRSTEEDGARGVAEGET